MCQIYAENCDKSVAKDRSLPSNSYIVTYMCDGHIQYDVVICHKRADVFDMYWDNYRENLKRIDWTEGRVNPRLWGHKSKESKKKK